MELNSHKSNICNVGDDIPDVDLVGAPLYKLLASGGANSHKEDEKDAVFSVGCVFYNKRTKVCLRKTDRWI